MSITADEMYRKIATDQGELIGLSASGLKHLITAMRSESPNTEFVGRLLKGITILNLEKINTEVTEAGYKLLIDTVRKNPKITSFNFGETCFTFLGKEFGLQKWQDIQYVILYLILKDDSRPIKLLNLSYSSMKCHGSRKGVSVPIGVKEVLHTLKKHPSIGALYLRNVPEYQQPWKTAETLMGGQQESDQLATELNSLLKMVSVQHLDIEGAGIFIDKVIWALSTSQEPIESINLNNNLINPDTFPDIIQLLELNNSLHSITMSNMKFVRDPERIRVEVENLQQQELYSKKFQTELAGGIKTKAMKRMQLSKEGFGSSASNSISLSTSSSSVLSVSSSSSSSSSSSTFPLTMSNMKFVNNLKRTRSEVENLQYQELYSKKFQTELAGIETRTTKRMQLSKEGSSSSASNSISPSSSSSRSSTMSTMASSSIPFLPPPSTSSRVNRAKEAIRTQKLSIKEMEELFEYFNKHLSEARTTQSMQLDDSDDLDKLSQFLFP